MLVRSPSNQRIVAYKSWDAESLPSFEKSKNYLDMNLEKELDCSKNSANVDGKARRLACVGQFCAYGRLFESIYDRVYRMDISVIDTVTDAMFGS